MRRPLRTERTATALQMIFTANAKFQCNVHFFHIQRIQPLSLLPMMHGKMGKVGLAGVAPQFRIRLSGIALSKIDARWSVQQL